MYFHIHITSDFYKVWFIYDHFVSMETKILSDCIIDNDPCLNVFQQIMFVWHTFKNAKIKKQ